MISKEVNQKFRDPLQRTEPRTSPGARTDRAASHNLSEKGTGGSTHSRNIQLVLLFLAPPSHQFSETLPSLKYLGSSLRLSHPALREPPS